MYGMTSSSSRTTPPLTTNHNGTAIKDVFDLSSKWLLHCDGEDPIMAPSCSMHTTILTPPPITPQSWATIVCRTPRCEPSLWNSSRSVLGRRCAAKRESFYSGRKGESNYLWEKRANGSVLDASSFQNSSVRFLGVQFHSFSPFNSIVLGFARVQQMLAAEAILTCRMYTQPRSSKEF